MANSVNVDDKLLIDGNPGKPGDVIASRGNKSPTWSPITKLVSKVKDKKSKTGEDKQLGIAGAAKEEILERTKGVLAEAFPLLTSGPYKRALEAIPGAGIAASIVKRAGILDKRDTFTTGGFKDLLPVEESPGKPTGKLTEKIKEGYKYEPPKGKGKGGYKSLATGKYVKKKEAVAVKKPAVTERASKKPVDKPGISSFVGKLFGKKEAQDLSSKETSSTIEKILDEVTKIREVLETGAKKDTGKKKTAKVIDTRPATTAPGTTGEEQALEPELKEGYIFEPPKGKGKGGFKSTKTGKYVKKEEATAVKKPSVTAAAGRKPGILGRAGQAVGGAARAGAGIARGAAGMALRAGAGAAAGAAGGIVGGLKLGAIITALAMFLPTDLKSLIGSIFEGILQGLGFDKDTIEAIFTPFRILSDIADLIKNIIGAVWDGVKWLFKTIGEIMDWFTGRSKVSAAEEASKATGGTGHGEFTTGGEAPAETTPIPQEAPAAPPAKETQPPPTATPASAPATPPTATPAPTPAAGAAPAAAPAPTPSAAPSAPVAVPVEPLPMFPQKVSEEEAVKVHEWFNKPENAAIYAQYNALYDRSSTIKKAIASTNALIRGETNPAKIKEHQRILKEELEPGLERTERQRKEILGMAREAARKEGGAADATPAAPPPTPTSSLGETGGGEGSVAGGSSGGGGTEAGGGGGGGGGAGEGGGEGGGAGGAVATAPSQPEQLSVEPSTGMEISKESTAIEAARDEPMPETNMSFVNDGEIAAGSVSENNNKVPTPDAPRDDLDVDIFFSPVS